jgi:hypothetical protein
MAQHQMVQIVRFAITRTVIAVILRHSCSFQHLTTTTFPHQVPLFELGRLHFIARFAHSFLTALQRNVQHVLLVTIILPPIFLALFLPSCRPNLLSISILTRFSEGLGLFALASQSTCRCGWQVQPSASRHRCISYHESAFCCSMFTHYAAAELKKDGRCDMIAPPWLSVGALPHSISSIASPALLPSLLRRRARGHYCKRKVRQNGSFNCECYVKATSSWNACSCCPPALAV